MVISDVYQKYGVTTLLAQHQLRAAAVGSFIVDHWKTETLDKETIIQTLLLHDMGNMIKFNFDYTWMFSEEELHMLPDLRKRQKELQAKYHGDEHVATYAIAKEIGVSDDVYYLLTHMGSSKLDATLASDNWQVKIVSYADLRCAPDRVVSVEERFADIIKRYEHGEHALSDIAKTRHKQELTSQLEAQLQGQSLVNLSTITEETTTATMENLATYHFS